MQSLQEYKLPYPMCPMVYPLSELASFKWVKNVRQKWSPIHGPGASETGAFTLLQSGFSLHPWCFRAYCLWRNIQTLT